MHRRNFFKWTGLGALGLALYGCGRNNKTLSQNRYYSGPTTNHFDGTYFYNSKDQVTAPMSDLLKWKLFGNRAKWPEHFVSPYSANVPETSLPAKTLRVTMIGHASLLIQMHGLNILTDPVYSKRVSPLQYIGPWRHNPPGVAFEALPKIDVVLVTHTCEAHCARQSPDLHPAGQRHDYSQRHPSSKRSNWRLGRCLYPQKWV
jgi:hypothetical protein